MIVSASKPAFAPLPRGARDLLPATCRRWRGLTRELLNRFEAWGYRPVRPSAIEYFEVIGRGLDAGVRERSLRFSEPGSGRVVALRADITPQIARMVAQRVGGSIEVGDQVRLCYSADTIAAPANAMGRAERHQVGVELLGELAPHGDAELVALADEALLGLGLSSHRFDLGETQILRRALAMLPEAARSPVRHALARKDPSALSSQLAAVDLSEPVRAAIAGLGNLYGEPHPTLARARTQLAALGVEQELERLQAVLEVLAATAPQTLARVELDLGEARGHAYYTGLRIRVWAPGSGEPLVRGGRYDALLERYGAAMPASGFAVDLDALERALAHGGDEADEGVSPATVIGLTRTGANAEARARAAHIAAGIRSAGGRAWVEVSDELARAQTRATRSGAVALLWFGAGEAQYFEQPLNAEVEPWRSASPPQVLRDAIVAHSKGSNIK